jgi:hypothetical protein
MDHLMTGHMVQAGTLQQMLERYTATQQLMHHTITTNILQMLAILLHLSTSLKQAIIKIHLTVNMEEEVISFVLSVALKDISQDT